MAAKDIAVIVLLLMFDEMLDVERCYNTLKLVNSSLGMLGSVMNKTGVLT